MFGLIKSVTNLAALATTGIAMVGGPGLSGGASNGGMGWGEPEKARPVSVESKGGVGNTKERFGDGDDSKFRLDIRFGDRDWGRRDHDRDDRYRPQPAVRYEAMPCNLELRAYQVEDDVIIVAQGENRTGGYTTLLERCDGGFGREGTIFLRNFGPGRGVCATQCVTPFEVTGSIHVRGCVEEIKVVVAGEVRCVRVSHVGAIRRG